MKKTKKIALCGILSALEITLLLLTGVFSLGEYALPALAGFISCFCVIEIDKKYAFVTFFVTSVLSLFLSPNKEAVFYYIIFFGYYPIIKASIEKISRKLIQWIIKLAIFNVADILFFAAMYLIFKIPEDSFEIFGVSLPIVFYIGFNFIFILYDIGISSVISTYVNHYRKYFKKIFK